MWPYIFVLIVSCGWVFLAGLVNKNYRSIFIPLLILTFFAALRHYTVGSDAPSYTLWFRIPVSTDSFIINKDIELGYQFLLKIMLSIFSNYAEYFFIVSVIVILPVLIMIRRYSQNYLFSFFIYITFGFYTALFNPVRQMIAVSLCFYAVRYIFEKKIVPFLIFIFIASLFHVSAWVMLPMFFVCNSSIRVEVKCLVAFLSSGLGASVAISYLAAGNVRYSNYTDAMNSNGNGLYTVVLYASIALFIYLFGSNLRKNNHIYRMSEQLYLIGVSILIPLVALKTDPSGPQRIISYFAVFLMIIFPALFKYINNKYMLFIFVIFGVVYYILTTLYFGNIYPYKINEIFDAF